MVTTSIIQKIQKLINHRDSAIEIGSIKEAAAFGERIQKLLTEHKLTMSNLEAKEEEKEGVSEGLAVDPRRFGMKDKDQFIPWIITLAKGIADANDCSIVVANSKPGRPGNRLVFVGVEADRQAAEEFYVYMAKLIWEMAGKEGERQKESMRQSILNEIGRCAPGHLSAKIHNFRHSYCRGFADVVVERLKEERKRQLDQQAAGSTALVLVNRRAVMVRTHMEKYRPASNAKVYGAGGVAEGYALGKKAGDSIALTAKTVNGRTVG